MLSQLPRNWKRWEQYEPHKSAPNLVGSRLDEFFLAGLHCVHRIRGWVGAGVLVVYPGAFTGAVLIARSAMIQGSTSNRVFKIGELNNETLASQLVLVGRKSTANLTHACWHLEEPVLSTLWAPQPPLRMLSRNTRDKERAR